MVNLWTVNAADAVSRVDSSFTIGARLSSHITYQRRTFLEQACGIVSFEIEAGNGVTAAVVKALSSLKSFLTMDDSQERALFISEYASQLPE
jgi:O-acetylhomoserine/O-acetylserine sulfhydrylase-like pyridoxal-dependent enzyme